MANLGASLFQKKHDVHKISARNSGAGNGCANFIGAWHFLVLSAGKTPMPIKFLLLGGGCWGFLEGGAWKCQFYFYGRGDFSDFWSVCQSVSERRKACFCQARVPHRCFRHAHCFTMKPLFPSCAPNSHFYSQSPDLPLPHGLAPAETMV